MLESYWKATKEYEKHNFFICDTMNGTCPDFIKNSYELLPLNGLILIYYIGDERVAKDFSHKNRKVATYVIESLYALVHQ